LYIDGAPASLHFFLPFVPKKAGPDQWVPVIRQAMGDRLLNVSPSYSKPSSVIVTSWTLPFHSRTMRVPGLNLRGALWLEVLNFPTVSVSLPRVCADRPPRDSSCIRKARIGSISSRRRRGDAGRSKLFRHNSLSRGLSNECSFTSKSAIGSTKTPYNSCVP
jgi:hypothetical protein